MKKLNLLFTALLLMCSVGTAKAEEVTIDGIKYDVITDTKQATVIWDRYYYGYIVIPSEITYNNVTCSVTSIGSGAFYDCSGLTSITIPNSVTSIGNEAFYYCYKLTSITIPNSVTSIGNNAFNGCSGLKEVHINDIAAWCNIDLGSSYANPLYYARNLYLNNELVTELIIPNSITSIKNYAFYGCSGLTSITIPNSVTSIGEKAFYYCTGLTSITIPNSVTSIGESAFSNCSGLTSITIPNSVTSIENNAFNGCSGLKSITIPNSVTSIGEKAFYYCSGLTSITIPNSVTSIGSYAFCGCSGLTSITIPNSVTSIGYGAFNWCSGLKEVHTNDLTAWCNIDFGSSYANPLSLAHNLYLNNELITELVIPNGVTSIESYAFYECSGLTSITIPNSVTSIREYAFAYCSGLTSITIPNSVTSIGEKAFYYCENLADVYCLATNVPATSSDAFYNLYPENITLHVPAEAINSYKTTAPWSNFGSIVEIFAGGEMVIDGIKYDINVNTKQATVISGGNYSGDIVIPSEITYNNVTCSVTSIGNSAFGWCSSLTSITIPNSVTSIGERAFYFCSGLTSVTIPNSITSIGYNAFDGCKGLKEVHINDLIAWCSINFGGDYANPLYYAHNLYLNNELITELVIPNSVTSIGDRAFEGCSDLKSVTIGNSVTSIGERAFEDCTGLESIVVDPGNTKYDSRDNCNAIIETESNTLIAGCKNTVIPNSVTSIGGFAFVDCTGLTSITIPNSVTSIGIAAFNASGLTSITIPNSVTSIGDGAFYYCDALTSVTMGNSVTSIGEQVFYGCRNLDDVYCLATNVPATSSHAFGSYPEDMKLHVPEEAIDSYKTTAPWNSFGNIVAIIVEKPKCDNPVIKYNNGEIEIECETTDAEFVTKITSSDINSFYSNSIALTATYNISVYATATGHDNSDTVNATLCWIECDCDADDNTDIINIPAKAVFVTSNNGTININCALEGEVVELYTIDAMYIGSTTIENGNATIQSGLSKGDIAIIKIAEKSIKVILN